MIVFLICKFFLLPALRLGLALFGSLDKGSCMLPPGLRPRQLWLPCCPQGLRHIIPEFLRCHLVLI